MNLHPVLPAIFTSAILLVSLASSNGAELVQKPCCPKPWMRH